MSKKAQAPVQDSQPEPKTPALEDLVAPITGIEPAPTTIEPGVEPAPTTIEPGVEPEPESLRPEEPMRTMLMAKRHVRAAVSDGVLSLLGGDFVTDGRHCAQLEHDTEHFVVMRVPASQVGVVERMYNEQLFMLRQSAGELGCHVVKDGTTKMPRFGG